MPNAISRRKFVTGVAGTMLATAVVPVPGRATERDPLSDGLVSRRDAFIDRMAADRGENPLFLAQRWDRFVAMRANQDLTSKRDARAFLTTPREEFVRDQDLGRAYDRSYLDIGYGATISGPHLVGRMTSALDVNPRDKVLEIGTGSGYQAAYLSSLTDHVWTVEIIEALSDRARHRFGVLAGRGYDRYGSIACKHADGYDGWAEAGPFDRIIVTCGTDHLPPNLVEQLAPGGIMVVPIGPSRGQHVLRIRKVSQANRPVMLASKDIFGGRTIRFVPFKRPEDVRNIKETKDLQSLKSSDALVSKVENFLL